MKTLSLALQTLGEMGRFSPFLTLTTQEPLLSPLGREWSLKISLHQEVPASLGILEIHTYISGGDRFRQPPRPWVKSKPHLDTAGKRFLFSSTLRLKAWLMCDNQGLRR